MILFLCAANQECMPKRIDSFVFSYDRRPHAQSLDSDFQRLGVRVQSVAKRRGFSIGAIWALLRFCRQERIELIHSHDLGPLMYAVVAKALSLGALKVVHTQHSFTHLDKRRRYRYYERFFTRFVDALVVVSTESAYLYANLGVPRKRILWIPNGVEFLEEAPSAGERKIKVRARLAEKHPELCARLNKVWILYLARVHEKKGQLHAVALWKRLPESVQRQAVLIFVGQESSHVELEKLRRQAEGLTSVVLAGPSDEPLSWIDCSDVLISLSEFEGMPLSPIEAYGAGLPLILSKIPGHSIFEPLPPGEVAWVTGVTDEGGVEAVSKVIQQMSGEPPSSRVLRFAGRSFWRENHSVEAMSGKYLEVYGQTGVEFDHPSL